MFLRIISFTLICILVLSGCSPVVEPVKEEPASEVQPVDSPGDVATEEVFQSIIEPEPIMTIYGDPADYTTQGLAYVGMVRGDVMELVFNEGLITRRNQVPYEQQPGDTYAYWMQGQEREHQWIIRDGEDYGVVVGKDGDMAWLLDEFSGGWTDHAWLEDPASYTVSLSEGGIEVQPDAVYRKSIPTGYARTSINAGQAPVRHTVYLKFGTTLKNQLSYRLQVKGTEEAMVDFAFRPELQHSNAIHSIQTGFRPDDPSKKAFVSTWMGDGGPLEYNEGTGFHIVDYETGEIAYSGQVELRLAADEPDGDATSRNYNLTSVYEMDFGALAVPGEYAVVVEGVGRSYPFVINEDAWEVPLNVVLRGFMHQRSGIELTEDIAGVHRPRNMHPDDPKVTVYHTDTTLADVLVNDTSMYEVFAAIIAGRTDEEVTNFWGGYHDAGDWDRRTHHLAATRLKLELVDLFPDRFTSDDRGIPESGNGMPDVIDEARWNLDAYARSQNPDGGIRGGAESAEHPISGEASWQESMTIMAFAPGIWASYVFAGDAARMSYVLEKTGAPESLTDGYREQAILAFAFADKKWADLIYDPMPFEFRDARNLAAAELFRLTGEQSYHDAFLETLVITSPTVPLAKWGTRADNAGHDQADAAFVYLLTQREGVDATIQNRLKQAYVKQANKMALLASKTGYAWTMPDPYAPLGWGRPATSQAVYLVRAHYLTSEQRFLEAAINTSLFGLGANPSNLVFTTGLGHNPIRNPHHRDSRYTEMDTPPGISVYGPFDVFRYSEQPGSNKNVDPYIWPAWNEWPSTESHIDNYELYMTNELTVYQTMGPNAYVWGYLHARP